VKLAEFESLRYEEYGHVKAGKILTKVLCAFYGDKAYYALRAYQLHAANTNDPFIIDVCRVAENFMIGRAPEPPADINVDELMNYIKRKQNA